ncbi:MAG: zinc ABC transporter [Candidatus Liberibacter europaeus]|uniref:High-affinity zinc uptake system protein ZnuA n=1 Tax=Candidatus Liberibacter europaeus TaxID=744859 RepID=A0A2T4VXK0_9HYPH|nr:zinc ABC transporter [Candidatus Liberibacter europaeus]PTL86504.1 MAG: zinc ABC transporter [Candidatus Liberibacter europaeus]
MKNIFILIIFSFFMCNMAMANSLRVVASIKPVHSIVSSIMYGVGNPILLVKDNSSPHEYSLRPSDGIMLDNADLIFWIGSEIESFLEKPLSSFNKTSNIITLSNSPNLHKILLHKKKPSWLDFGNYKRGDHDHGSEIYDMHLWLDPTNTKHIAHVIAMELIKKDPYNQKVYEQNEKEFVVKLEKLDKLLYEILQPVLEQKIVVFHGAYHHFKSHYGINITESVMPRSVSPGAKSFRRIKDGIISGNVSCVFYEPEFDSKIIKSITDDTGVNVGILDPEGILLPAGPNLYFHLMEDLARSIAKKCKPANYNIL